MSSTPELPIHLGAIGVGQFFDAGLCRRLRADVCGSALEPARVRVRDSEEQVNEHYRRSGRTQLRTSASGTVEHCLARLRVWISGFYGVGLRGFEPPQYLVYRPGDFFSRHADGPAPGEYSLRPSARKVSLVIFLNGETGPEPEAGFSGGALSLYDGSTAWDVRPEEGLLVTFPSFLMHEVKPITAGERFSVVSWYY